MYEQLYHSNCFSKKNSLYSQDVKKKTHIKKIIWTVIRASNRLII